MISLSDGEEEDVGPEEMMERAREELEASRRQGAGAGQESLEERRGRMAHLLRDVPGAEGFVGFLTGLGDVMTSSLSDSLGKAMEKQNSQLAACLNLTGSQVQEGRMETRDLIKLAVTALTKGEGGQKRKKDDHEPEEKVTVKAGLEGGEMKEDDAHEVINWELRAKLANPNGPVDQWWTKDTPVKTGPRLGSNLNLEALTPGRVNEATSYKVYDRCEVLASKHWLTKNSGHLGSLKKNVRTDYRADEGSVRTSVEVDYRGAGDCWEAVEGVLNYAAHLWAVRPWDYSGLAMLRAGHGVRWFQGVARSPADQAKTIEKFISEAHVRNVQKGRQGKPPLTYEDLVKLAKDICHMADLPEAGLMTGDPYSGQVKGKKDQRDLEADRRRRQEDGSGRRREAERSERRGHSGGGRDSRDREGERERQKDRDKKELERKLAFTCEAFNSKDGCKPKAGEVCRDKHNCNRVVGPHSLCWGRHPSVECTRR